MTKRQVKEVELISKIKYAYDYMYNEIYNNNNHSIQIVDVKNSIKLTEYQTKIFMELMMMASDNSGSKNNRTYYGMVRDIDRKTVRIAILKYRKKKSDWMQKRSEAFAIEQASIEADKEKAEIFGRSEPVKRNWIQKIYHAIFG